jgi:hypothetical protein
MKTIEENPFRVLGILSNSSLKDIKESETRIKRYVEVGKSPKLKFDLSPPLCSIDRTEQLITYSKNKIHTPRDKFVHSLFWFVSDSMIDKIALEKLTSDKNIDAALETFSKGSRGFTVSDKTFSSILNHSTLDVISYPIHKKEDRLISAIKRKFEIVQNKKTFSLLENLITGESSKLQSHQVTDELMIQTKSLLKDLFPRRDQSKLLLSVFDENSIYRKEIEVKISEQLIKDIGAELSRYDLFFEDFENKSESNCVRSKSTLLKEGETLVSKTKTLINKLKSNLGKDDYQFEKTLNNIYERANYSVIFLFNLEMGKLNTSINLGDSTAVVKYDFSNYIKYLEIYKKNLHGLNCDIKSTITANLKGVKNMQQQLVDIKSQIGLSSTRSSYSSNSYSSNSYNSGGVSPAVGQLIGYIVMMILMATCAQAC